MMVKQHTATNTHAWILMSIVSIMSIFSSQAYADDISHVHTGDDVTVDYNITTETGVFIDSGTDTYPAGWGTRKYKFLDTIPVDMQVGETRVVPLDAQDAFGVYDSGLVEIVRDTEFANKGIDPIIGESYMIRGRNILVKALDTPYVTIDANDPYAGQKIRATITLTTLEGKQLSSYTQSGTINPWRLRKLLAHNYYLGNSSGNITIIAYTDSECRPCKSMHSNKTLATISEHAGDVSYAYKPIVIRSHEMSEFSALATTCAGKFGGATAYNDVYRLSLETTKSEALESTLRHYTSQFPRYKKWHYCVTSKAPHMDYKGHSSELDMFAQTGVPTLVFINKKTKKRISVPGMYSTALYEDVLVQIRE